MDKRLPAEPVLTVESARKSYGAVKSLDGVNLSVHDGEVVGVLGPNGAGKSTLLEAIIGARRLDGGRIRVAGIDPQVDRVRAATHQAMQPQSSSMFRYLSVTENLQLWHDLYPSPMRVDDVIDLVGLGDKRVARTRTLSGGQLQRLRLGLAIIANTELTMFDEPTVGLDPLVRDFVWDVIRDCARHGAVLLATQLMDEAEALCDRVVIIDRGQIVCEGTVSDLVAELGFDGSVTFSTDAAVSVDELRALNGVVRASVRPRGRTLSVRLVTSDRVATQLAVSRHPHLQPHGYRSTAPSFREVFLSVVADPEAESERE